jgi:hypothetical protein
VRALIRLGRRYNGERNGEIPAGLLRYGSGFTLAPWQPSVPLLTDHDPGKRIGTVTSLDTFKDAYHDWRGRAQLSTAGDGRRPHPERRPSLAHRSGDGMGELTAVHIAGLRERTLSELLPPLRPSDEYELSPLARLGQVIESIKGAVEYVEFVLRASKRGSFGWRRDDAVHPGCQAVEISGDAPDVSRPLSQVPGLPMRDDRFDLRAERKAHAYAGAIELLARQRLRGVKGATGRAAERANRCNDQDEADHHDGPKQAEWLTEERRHNYVVGRLAGPRTPNRGRRFLGRASPMTPALNPPMLI